MNTTSPRHSLDTAGCDVDIHELLVACDVNVHDVQVHDIQLPASSDFSSEDLHFTAPEMDFTALLTETGVDYETGDDWIAMTAEIGIDAYSSDDSTEVLDAGAAKGLERTNDQAPPSEAAEKATIYLAKIHSMLEQCPASVAAWTNGGTSFAIYNCAALEKTILPTFFKPIKFESFARQLNSYGFKKTKLIENRAIVYEFSHPRFVRGQVDQLQTIKRRRRRMQRLSALDVEDMTDGEFRASFGDMVRFVQSLHAEVAEMKSLVKSLVEASTEDAPKP